MACTTPPSPDQRLAGIMQQVQQAHWVVVTHDTGHFALMSMHGPKLPSRAQTLRVYIEGDGLAWIDPNTPAMDPTPVRATALEMAMADPAPFVMYLGRPCQYVRGSERHGCDARWWTSHRFAPEVMQSTAQALDRIKQTHGVKQFELVGYSGGGTVAAVMAAQRTDVSRLVTVAGNLDPETWARLKRLSPLAHVVNPTDLITRLRQVPQAHLFGAQDSVVPVAVSNAYLSRLQPSASHLRMIMQPGFNHQCCWAEQWPELLKEVFDSPAAP